MTVMKQVWQNMMCAVGVLLSVGGMMSVSYADDTGSSSRQVNRKQLSPVEQQLKLIESLMRIRLAPMELREGMPLNKILDRLERQFEESGKTIKFVRAASEDDFSAPLSDKKIKYDCTIAGGSSTDVLASVCHEAGCAYCIRGGEVHVFPTDKEPLKETMLMPYDMVRECFEIGYGRADDDSGSAGESVKLRKGDARKYPIGRTKLRFESKKYQLTMLNSAPGLLMARVSLNNMYTDWVKKNRWSYYKNEVSRMPRFVAESHLNNMLLVPVVWDEDCSLADILHFFDLQSRLGKAKRSMRIGTELKNPASVTFSGKLDFSSSSMLDALTTVCDACQGHYLVKGRKVTIVPRQLETRSYWVNERLHERLKKHGLKNAPRVDKDSFERKKKNTKLVVSDMDSVVRDQLLLHLEQYGIEIEDPESVTYDANMRKVEFEASQKLLLSLDRLYDILIPVTQK